VLDIVLALLEIVEHAAAQRVEALRLEGLVEGTPPDLALGGRLAHDELVVGRAAGMVAGADDEGPALGHHAFVAPKRLLLRPRRRIVPALDDQVAKTVLPQPEAGPIEPRLQHSDLPIVRRGRCAAACGRPVLCDGHWRQPAFYKWPSGRLGS